MSLATNLAFIIIIVIIIIIIENKTCLIMRVYKHGVYQILLCNSINVTLNCES